MNVNRTSKKRYVHELNLLHQCACVRYYFPPSVALKRFTTPGPRNIIRGPTVVAASKTVRMDPYRYNVQCW